LICCDETHLTGLCSRKRRRPREDE
jgi:hypothetical protein